MTDKPPSLEEYGLYRFIRKRANGADAVRFAADDVLVIVAIGMSMSEFQPGSIRIPDIERMIEWAKHNTAVHTPTHIVMVAVTSHDGNPEWNKSFTMAVELAGLPTTVVQLLGNHTNEDFGSKTIMRGAAELLKSDGSARAIVQKLHLGAHPMQADLVTSDSSSPAPYIPVAEPRDAIHQEFAPEGSLFVRHKEFGTGARSGGQYNVTNLWAFKTRWIKFGNTIEFTPQSELATREGQEKMPIYRRGYGPASEPRFRIATIQPRRHAGGGPPRAHTSLPSAETTSVLHQTDSPQHKSREQPWHEWGMTEEEYNETLTLEMLRNEELAALAGGGAREQPAAPPGGGGAAREQPWHELGMTEEQYNEDLAIDMLAEMGYFETAGMATTTVV